MVKVKYPEPLKSEVPSKIMFSIMLGNRRKKQINDTTGINDSTTHSGLQALTRKPTNYVIALPVGEKGRIIDYLPNYKKLKEEFIISQINYLPVTYFFPKKHFPETHKAYEKFNRKMKLIKLQTRKFHSKTGIEEVRKWKYEITQEIQQNIDKEMEAYIRTRNEDQQRKEFLEMLEQNTPIEVKKQIDEYFNTLLNTNQETKNQFEITILKRLTSFGWVIGFFYEFLMGKSEQLLHSNISKEYREYLNSLYMNQTNNVGDQLTLNAWACANYNNDKFAEDTFNNIFDIIGQQLETNLIKKEVGITGNMYGGLQKTRFMNTKDNKAYSKRLQKNVSRQMEILKLLQSL